MGYRFTHHKSTVTKEQKRARTFGRRTWARGHTYEIYRGAPTYISECHEPNWDLII